MFSSFVCAALLLVAAAAIEVVDVRNHKHSSWQPPSALGTTTLDLFAVIGYFGCATNLPYGPLPISAEDTTVPYLCTKTAHRAVAHKQWLQIVTTGYPFQEMFRIVWTFNESKTIAERFVDAVAHGEDVQFTVTDEGLGGRPAGREYRYKGKWRYSSAAGINSDTFRLNQFSTDGFSQAGGAWGAGSEQIDGNIDPPADFWGIGSFKNHGDSECFHIFCNGTDYGKVKPYYGTLATYMWSMLDTDAIMQEAAAPSDSQSFWTAAFLASNVIVLLVCAALVSAGKATGI